MATNVGSVLYAFRNGNDFKYTNRDTFTDQVEILTYDSEGNSTGNIGWFADDNLSFDPNGFRRGGYPYEVTKTFVPAISGWYNLRLIGGGGASKGNGNAYSGGSGAGIFLDVLLNSSITYTIQAGEGGYFRDNTFHTEQAADPSFLKYTAGGVEHIINAGGAEKFSNDTGANVGGVGGTASITGTWTTRNIVLNANGSNGYKNIADPDTGYCQFTPGVQSVATSLIGNTHGYSQDIPAGNYSGGSYIRCGGGRGLAYLKFLEAA